MTAREGVGSHWTLVTTADGRGPVTAIPGGRDRREKTSWMGQKTKILFFFFFFWEWVNCSLL